MKKRKIDNSYMVGNVRYVTCTRCGREIKGVGDTTVAGICSNCVIRMIPLEEPKGYKPTGRPPGWHFMAEFVDKDGNVFHKGKEMKKLKGTLPSTKVKPPKKKIKRRTKEQILIDRHKEKKIALKKAVKKQQDFINHTINKG
jgi:hypothetical protein